MLTANNPRSGRASASQVCPGLQQPVFSCTTGEREQLPLENGCGRRQRQYTTPGGCVSGAALRIVTQPHALHRIQRLEKSHNPDPAPIRPRKLPCSFRPLWQTSDLPIRSYHDLEVGYLAEILPSLSPNVTACGVVERPLFEARRANQSLRVAPSHAAVPETRPKTQTRVSRRRFLFVVPLVNRVKRPASTVRLMALAPASGLKYAS
ncbi:hypothetical protein EV126DRAFT_258155 [Verticillium dahliae]|nr:hypothetical protein EV126DRAFT_258155 [Verticillium dahliae]